MPNGTPSEAHPEPPRILVMVGLPGSGKSTWIERQGYTGISSDEIRRLLSDDPENQTIHGEVFGTLRYLLRRRLDLKRPVSCVDATNLTPKERRAYLKLGEIYGARVEAVYFDIPLDICKQRNRGRGRKVPEEVLEMMQAKLVPPRIEEGFASVTVVTL
ncbi:MAG: AAA family ATPase [Bryobacteraceae bacterium]